MNYFGWLFDSSHWTGDQGIGTRLVEHLGYVGLVMVISIVIAVPLGAWIGHTGRGGVLVVGLSNGFRALPTLGLLVLLAGPFGLSFTGPAVALVILAVPSILAGAYSGVRNVDPAVVDAATGMGMRDAAVLFRVELPNALPLILGGVRSALLQVVATATVAAYVGLGGLGRFIFDGLAVRDFPQMIAGSLLVAVLAIVLDLVLAALQRLVVSPGLRLDPGRSRSRRPATARRAASAASTSAAPEPA